MENLSNNANMNQQSELPGARSTAPTEGEQSAPDLGAAQLQPDVEMTTPAGSITHTTTAESLSRSLIAQPWVFALVAILALAVALRVLGLNWDEGQHLHPDERFLTMVESAIRLPDSLGQYFDTAQSPLNPYNNNFGSFVYGTAPLFFVRLVGQLIGLTDYENVVLLGRALSALADVFVVAMTFAIGRRLYGLRIGLLAALLYSLSVLPIKQSHFFTVDTFTNVPLMLAFWFTLDIAERKHGRWAFILTGAWFGLMLASRINLAPFIGIIALAVALRLMESLKDIQSVTVEINGLEGKRTFEAADSSGADSTEVREALPMRTFRIGPLLIEIEFKPDARTGTEHTNAKSGLRITLRQVLIGMVLTAVAAFIIFRIAQPYAFDGFFALNPQFLDDMASAQRVVSGQDDYPPSHQWTNRTPYWFPWYNLVVWGLGPALGFAAWLGVALAAFQLVRYQRWEHLLISFWVMGMFLYHGQQFVTTMRYFLPLYPFLTIFAAFFLFTVWDRAKAFAQTARDERLARSARFLAGSLFAAVIGLTLFWALAATSIYTRTNTRVAASRWIYANVSNTAVIGSEHWDDVLPLRVDGKDYYYDHQGVMLDLYGEDTPEKREQMVGWMDQVDYIILSSNRLYGSIPRLPMRFPLTTQYYQWLFNGQLGFEQVQEFTSYPRFLGITIIDDSAEEAFTVYDHPKVTIFQKTSAYSHDNTVALFDSVDLTEVLRLKPIDATASRRQFRMSPDTVVANRAGGTWSDIFNPGDLANRFPVAAWLVMVWLIGALAFPFTFVVFRTFGDRGYAFAKSLGILFVAWAAWTLSSYHILPFGRLPILFGLIVMVLFGVLIVRRRWHEMRAYLKANFKILLIEELIFFVFFAIDLAIRYQNPDLWHPWMGGERPMDFAYLNAILKTTYFPPYNPWFAGNYINYYYFGQLISAALIRLSGITPEVAYNLLLPMFFGLTASGAFGVVFNLVWSGRQRLKSNTQSPAEGTSASSLLLPGLAGMFGVILVLIIGNLGEFKLIFEGLTNLGGGSGLSAFISGLNLWLFGGQIIPIPIGDWYWTATRTIPDTINEFPFFTFIYGDLHAHLIAIPYTLIALGLAIHIVLSHSKLQWSDLALSAVVLGALRAINTWDYPTYLAMVGGAMVLRLGSESREQDNQEPFQWHEWLQLWLRFILVVFFQVMLIMVPLKLLGIQMNLEVAILIAILVFGVLINLNQSGKSWNPHDWVQKVGWPFLAIIALAVLFFLPYILNYATGYASMEWWEGVKTTFSEYLTVHGIFLFLVASFLIVVLLTNYLREGMPDRLELEFTGWAVYAVPLLIIAEIILIAVHLPILALVLPILGLGLWILLHRRTPLEVGWVTVLILVSILLTLLVELVVLKGDVGRTNTVFKFYLQAWVMFGVASAAGLGLIFEHLAVRRRNASTVEAATPLDQERPATTRTGFSLSSSTLRTIRWAWWVLFGALILEGLLYPFAAASAKMSDRYVMTSLPGLNGMEFMQGATYNENDQDLVLYWDYDAIQWMRQNIEGSPVIMEGNAGLYRWGNRYSIYTGLPTVMGWDWHTKQQYSLLPGDLIDYRTAVVQEFYNTFDQSKAAEIARRYDVEYVIVGSLERALYDANGLDKFDRESDLWSLVYQNEHVKIYQVVGQAR